MVKLTLHKANSLPKSDVIGSSDPYVTVSFHRDGKVLYRTRTIFDDLNPVWEETAYILVKKDDIQNKQCIHLKVWDEDKWSEDDSLGQTNITLSEIVNSTAFNDW